MPNPAAVPGAEDDLTTFLESVDLGVVEDFEPPPGESKDGYDRLTNELIIGRQGDYFFGTVEDVFRDSKPGDKANIKVCPLGPKCPHQPLAKGESVTVERTMDGLRVTVWANHNHGGEKQTKDGKFYAVRFWRPPLPTFSRGDHAELGRDLAAKLPKVKCGASSTDAHGVRVYDDRKRSPKCRQGGTWAEFPPELLHRIALEYGGRLVVTGDGDKVRTRPISLKVNDVRGIVSVARTMLHEPDDKYFTDTWIAFENNVHLNVFTGATEPPEAFHRVLEEHVLPFNYSPDARCPLWESFLTDVLVDGDKVSFLQEFVGACLHGHGAAWEHHPVLVGSGANGKSTLIKVIAALFPKDATASSAPASWSRTFGRTSLRTARINLITEMEDRELLASGALKAILSGDPIQVERKYEDPVTIRPKAGHILACNRLPTAADRSHGFYRKLVVLSFPRTFPGDDSLEMRLKRELPGIYQWARLGFERRKALGKYTIPASSIAARKEWREQGDSTLAWAAEALTVDQGARSRASTLYTRYKVWCERTGHRPVSSRTWGETMASEFTRGDDKHGRWYAAHSIPDLSALVVDPNTEHLPTVVLGPVRADVSLVEDITFEELIGEA